MFVFVAFVVVRIAGGSRGWMKKEGG